MRRKKILLSWSGGKDSAWSLHLLRQQSDLYQVAALLTTVNARFARVAIHGFREELLDLQAAAAGLPVWKIPLPYPCTNAVYEAQMREAVARALTEKFDAVAFGDLFLEDIRAYRIERLSGTGLEPIFPVWGIPTDQLARQMIASGLQARVTCIDPRRLDSSFAGRAFDQAFLEELPPAVDPCGERGEFHTFACAGPMFSHAVPVTHTETIEREGFVYAEMLPTGPRNLKNLS